MSASIWADDKKAMMIRQARKRLGMKQSDFAEMLGSSPATVCQWEMGRRIPRGPSWRMFLLLVESKGIQFDTSGVVIDKPARKRKAA